MDNPPMKDHKVKCAAIAPGGLGLYGMGRALLLFPDWRLSKRIFRNAMPGGRPHRRKFGPNGGAESYAGSHNAKFRLIDKTPPAPANRARAAIFLGANKMPKPLTPDQAETVKIALAEYGATLAARH